MATFHRFRKFPDFIYENRFYILFGILLMNLLIPEIKDFPMLVVIFQVLIALAGANLIDEKHHHLRKLWIWLSILILVVIILQYIYEDPVIDKITYAFSFCFFTLITINLFMQISRLQVISADVIIGAFCGYMLIGLMGFYVYSILEKFTPGSFTNLPAGHKSESLFYYSYVVLSTTGFGDITPVTFSARKISVLFAIIGQFYMGVIIAILISKYLQNPSKKQN